jgi:hypothetical protein
MGDFHHFLPLPLDLPILIGIILNMFPIPLLNFDGFASGVFMGLGGLTFGGRSGMGGGGRTVGGGRGGCLLDKAFIRSDTAGLLDASTLRGLCKAVPNLDVLLFAYVFVFALERLDWTLSPCLLPLLLFDELLFVPTHFVSQIHRTSFVPLDVLNVPPIYTISQYK